MRRRSYRDRQTINSGRGALRDNIFRKLQIGFTSGLMVRASDFPEHGEPPKARTFVRTNITVLRLISGDYRRRCYFVVSPTYRTEVSRWLEPCSPIHIVFRHNQTTTTTQWPIDEYIFLYLVNSTYRYIRKYTILFFSERVFNISKNIFISVKNVRIFYNPVVR